LRNRAIATITQIEWGERNKLPHLKNVMNEAEREKFIS